MILLIKQLEPKKVNSTGKCRCMRFFFCRVYDCENGVSTVYWLFIISSYFILEGNENMHYSLDEFEFRPDLNTDYGVSFI